MEWIRQTSVDKFTKHVHNAGGNIPDSILINGRGQLSNDDFVVPMPKFVVEQVIY